MNLEEYVLSENQVGYYTMPIEIIEIGIDSISISSISTYDLLMVIFNKYRVGGKIC